jgi:hypothetical protein
MAIPESRLFSITMGPIEDGIPDKRLRSRVDKALMSSNDLKAAAELTGKLAITHDVVDDKWTINIDADSQLHEELSLLRTAQNASLAPSQAADRVVDMAMQHIREFVASQQSVNLASVEEAAKRARAAAVASASPVIRALRREPSQTLKLTTRQGEVSLSLQSMEGQSVRDEDRLVKCWIVRMGATVAFLRLPRGQRQDLPQSLGREPKLVFRETLAAPDNLIHLYSKFVVPIKEVVLRVREVESRRSGKVIALQLQELPG